VNPNPDAPTVAPSEITICSGQEAALTATGPIGATFNWYTNSLGGVLVYTGNPFSTTPLTSDTAFYVEALLDGCTSLTRTEVAIKISPNPNAPTVEETDITICSGQSATLTATAPEDATFKWYTESSGGILVFTGPSFTTESLYADTTYYVESDVNGCLSLTRTAVAINVNGTPAAPSVSASDSICSGQPTSLTATAPIGATFDWYTSASGGTSIFTGATFTTPILTANTTYYAEASVNGCISVNRTPIEITVKTIPAAPTLDQQDTSVCSGTSLTLSANAPAGATFNWYDEASGVTPVYTGASFTTPVLTTSQTYYVESVIDGCVSSTRTELTIQVNPIPDAPTVTPENPAICSGETATLYATGPTGATFYWYSSASEGTLFHTGATFETPALTSTTSYYVEDSLGGCASSSRTQVTIQVNPIPSAPTVEEDSLTICYGQTVEIIASAPADAQFSWYTTSSGEFPIYTGTTFTTPVLFSDTAYYVESSVEGCVSATRTQVTIQVNPLPPTPTVASTTQSVCSGQTAILTATSSEEVDFNWYSTATGGTPLYTGDNFITPPIFANVNYYVEASLNGCQSSTRAVVIVQVSPLPNDPTVLDSELTKCSGQTATLETTAPLDATFNWYTTSTGGTPVYTGESFTTPALTESITYYVEALYNNCTSLNRTPVAITVNPTPSAPTVAASEITICAGESAELIATGPADASFEWYTEPSGGISVFSGSTYTTPALSESSIYYVEATQGACTSYTRTGVTVLVNPIPDAPDVISSTVSICSGQSATLSATGPNGATFNWFSESTGGSILFTGANYTTPSLVADTIFYVESAIGGCTSSARTAVSVQVYPPTEPPVVTPSSLTICSGEVTTISAEGAPGATITWYTVATGGTPIYTGADYLLPPLFVDTAFYAEASVNGCSSPTRTEVVIQATPLPDNPSVASTNVSVCTGQSTTLSATAPEGATFNWYTTSTGGSPVFTGNLFTTPVISSNSTYYVEAFLNGCYSSGRTTVTIETIPTPATPTVASATVTICSGESATLTALTAEGATFNWYDTPSGGTSLFTGASYTTPLLTSSTIYYVEASNESCTNSNRTGVSVQVNTIPDAPSVISDSITICYGASTVVSATGPIGATFNWYDTPSGGTSLFTGATYTTPALVTSTTYYVESTIGGCTSATRTSVSIYIAPIPDVPTLVASTITICAGSSATLLATAPEGATFNWYTTSSGGTLLHTGAQYITPALTSDTSYYVESIVGGCPSLTRASVSIQVTPTPSNPTVAAPVVTICSGETATLSATAPLEATFNWYSSATGGTPLYTGATYTTPYLTSSITYYVNALVDGCISSGRTSVTVEVAPKPIPPTVAASQVSICSGTSATLSTTGPEDVTFAWYAVPSGGTALYTGSTYITPSITSSTIYYVESITENCTSQNRTAVTVQVQPTPAAPTLAAASVSICSGQTATLSATSPAGATFNWYLNASDESSIFTGATFTTGILTANTSYYVESTVNGCNSSTRSVATVLVSPLPDNPSVASSTQTICSGQTALLTATAPAGAAFKWYTTNTGGTSVYTGANFLPPPLEETSTYYVEATSAGCNSSSRTAVTVQVTPLPANPTVASSNVTICSGTSAILAATAPDDVVFNWYTTSTGGSSIYTGATYTTPYLTSGLTYYVEAQANSCYSSGRTAVNVQVTPAPASPTVAASNLSVCSGTSASLSATGPVGATFNWYTSPSGGSPVHTGTTYSTPPATASTIYYVESNVDGCISQFRTGVTVNVIPGVSVPTVLFSNVTICSGQSATLSATGPSGAIFNWFTSSTGGSPVFTGANFSTPALLSGTTYYVEASQGSCVSPARTAVNVLVNELPSAPSVATSTISVCSGQTASLAATAPLGATFKWYTVSSGGTTAFTGANYTTPYLYSNTSYFVEAIQNGCVSASRTAVNIEVGSVPSTPTVASNNVIVCTGDSATLEATGPAGASFNWYTVSTGGTSVYTGATYTTPEQTASTFYYVEATVGVCTSATRRTVGVTVFNCNRSAANDSVEEEIQDSPFDTESVVPNRTSSLLLNTYPNPTHSRLTIIVSGEGEENVLVTITDTQGQKYYSTVIRINSNKEIDLSEQGMPAGLYFIRATSNNQDTVKKIIKY